MRRIDELLRMLDRVKRLRSGHWQWKASCPLGDNHSHGDRNPSLMLREDVDGRVWIKCYGGCDKESILSALGLTWRDLYPDSSAVPWWRREPAGELNEEVWWRNRC